MRPIYQTQNDLDNETSVLTDFETFLLDDVYFATEGPVKNDFWSIKSPNFSCYDYVLTCGDEDEPGDPIALIEVKQRRYKSNSFPTYKISKKKIDNIICASYERNMISMLIVQWNDAVTSMIICNPFDQIDNYLNSPVTDEGFSIFDNWCGDMNSYISRGKITTTTWGRTDRNDPRDIEAAYEIPMTLFRSVD
jgi:hypothetical protein|tara:strand:+ start:1864 stop:2442 length:579 start_codon:yes stop_codon:yes gene_type:complete